MKKKSIDFGNVKSLKTAAVGFYSFYFIIKSKKFWLFAYFIVYYKFFVSLKSMKILNNIPTGNF